jgi:hypothetical protein
VLLDTIYITIPYSSDEYTGFGISSSGNMGKAEMVTFVDTGNCNKAKFSDHVFDAKK